MPAEIKVGPPGITISQGRTFMVTDECGEIAPNCDEGVFAIDTRFISGYHISVNGQPWTLLTASQISFYAARIYLTNPVLYGEDAEVPANTIGLTIDRMVGEGIHEDFTLTNYSGKLVRLVLELTLQADFADIFEAKARRFMQRGRLHTNWGQAQRALHICFSRYGFHRAMVYQIPACGATNSVGFANGCI